MLSRMAGRGPIALVGSGALGTYGEASLFLGPVTDTVDEVELPAASRATAVTECDALLAVRVFHGIE